MKPGCLFFTSNQLRPTGFMVNFLLVLACSSTRPLSGELLIVAPAALIFFSFELGTTRECHPRSTQLFDKFRIKISASIFALLDLYTVRFYNISACSDVHSLSSIKIPQLVSLPTTVNNAFPVLVRRWIPVFLACLNQPLQSGFHCLLGFLWCTTFRMINNSDFPYWKTILGLQVAIAVGDSQQNIGPSFTPTKQ